MPEQITVYRLDELPPDVQEKVIDRYRQHYFEHWWLADAQEFIQNELDLRGLEGLTAYWTMYVQGSGLGLQGTVHLSDLLNADVESWVETHDRRNVHLKPSAIEGIAPNIADDLDPRWTLTTGCNGACFTVHNDGLWDDVEGFIEREGLADGLEPDNEPSVNATTYRREGEALDGLVQAYLQRLADDLLRALYDYDKDQGSEESMRDMIAANYPDDRFTITGTKV